MDDPNPTNPATIADLLAPHPARSAALLNESGSVLSYGQLRDLAARTTEVLNGCGIGRGDPVALVLDNGPHMAAAFVAVAHGAAAAPLNPVLREGEFLDALESLRAKALIVEQSSGTVAATAAARLGIRVITLERTGASGTFRLELPRTTARPAGPGPAGRNDTALLLHTSGTTARPKLVPLSQQNLVTSAGNISRTLWLGPEDTCVNIMPLFHIHGLLGALLASLHAGGTVAAMPGFQPMRFLRWLGELDATWYSAVPTMHQAILQRSQRSSGSVGTSLRLIRSSSAALPPSVLRSLESRFDCPVIESYGMTEASHQMASNPLPPLTRKPGTVGPQAGPEMAVMDKAGRLQPAGATGEIVIRGANVMAGYLDNPEANADAFRDGWFRTGDEGYRDTDGYYAIIGRLKELINRGGEKISPREIDEALLEHPAIAQAVAFAAPHAKLGEEVGAAIVLEHDTSLTLRQVREFAAERLAPFKVPRVVVFVDAIPKGPTGKLKRVGLARDLGID